MKSVFNGNTMNRTSTLAFKNVNCQLSIVKVGIVLSVS